MSKKGRRPRTRPTDGLMRSIERIQRDQGLSRGDDARIRRERRPVNSVDVANAAINSLGRIDNTPKNIKQFAEAVMELWAKPVSAVAGREFWTNPDNKDYLFFRDSYLSGLDTLAFASLGDLFGPKSNPSAKVGGLFAPDRKAAAELSRDRLLEAAGSLSVLQLLDQPVPSGMELHTYTDHYRDLTNQNGMPTRLAGYDPRTVQEFANTIGYDQYVLLGYHRYYHE